MSTFFIAGIGTEVGKTVVSAIVTQALQADYFKPVQAGDLQHTDTDNVKTWVKNPKTTFHSSAFELKTPMSPHAAAAIDKVDLSVASIKRPKTKNHLVIEGAGGLLVPLNAQETIADLIQPNDKIILVSRHYLGSINHTLLSVELLKQRGLTCSGIIFNGNPHPTTEQIIEKMAKVPIIGRIGEEPYIDNRVIEEYAAKLQQKLATL